MTWNHNPLHLSQSRLRTCTLHLQVQVKRGICFVLAPEGENLDEKAVIESDSGREGFECMSCVGIGIVDDDQRARAASHSLGCLLLS